MSKVHSTSCRLLYTDDILIFVRTCLPSLRALQNLLQCYQTSVGKMFNLQKSQLYIGHYNRRSQRKTISIFGITKTTTFCMYLGVPMVFGFPKKKIFHYLIDKINSKLTAWEARSLSFADLLILIKHVLSSIPLHTTSALPLPTSTCHDIEKLMTNFLWSGNAPSKKANYVR